MADVARQTYTSAARPPPSQAKAPASQPAQQRQRPSEERAKAAASQAANCAQLKETSSKLPHIHRRKAPHID